MNRNQGVGRALAAAALIAAAALAGCGKQGPLERPRPLFGEKAKAQYDAERAQEAKDEAQRAAQRKSGDANQSAGDNAPITSRNIQDPAQRLSPASSSPISGAPNPLGAPVQPRPSN